MLILAQNRTVLVNMDRIDSIVVRNLEDNKFRILAYYGNKDTDCWGIGDYETEKRAKGILLEIMRKYAQYLHRPASPAMLKGSLDISEAIFALEPAGIKRRFWPKQNSMKVKKSARKR